MPTPRDNWQLDTRHIGRRILVYDSVPSTNDVAAVFAADADNSGLVLIADHQSSGRGQYGRVWQSRPGTSLLMSVVLAPPTDLRRPVLLTAWAAVGIAKAIRGLSGLPVRLKWPNDLLVAGKKTCGILIEQSAGIVVGIGLNLNQSLDDFATCDLPGATSLAVASGKPIDQRLAAIEVIRQLDTVYELLLRGERTHLECDWKQHLGLINRPICAVLADGTTVTGRLRELSFDGIEIESYECHVRVLRPEYVRQLQAI